MTQIIEVLKYLSSISPEGICDDCLSQALKFSQRQNSNRITRSLETASKIEKCKKQCPQCGVYKLCSNHLNITEFHNKMIHKTPENLNQLIEIGFLKIGKWNLSDNKLIANLEKLNFAQPALYAFILNGNVMYVGKTKRPLSKRIEGYRRGHKGQKTNHRINLILMELMKKNKIVEIYGFCSTAPFKLGPFDVNLAAGLEDSIIAELKPIWNLQ